MPCRKKAKMVKQTYPQFPIEFIKFTENIVWSFFHVLCFQINKSGGGKVLGEIHIILTISICTFITYYYSKVLRKMSTHHQLNGGLSGYSELIMFLTGDQKKVSFWSFEAMKLRCKNARNENLKKKPNEDVALELSIFFTCRFQFFLHTQKNLQL